jgi:hypothetical protein
MMADAEFHVTDRRAPRRAAAPGIRGVAGQIAADAAAATPVRTGTLRAGWHTEQGTRDPATTFVVNGVRYARFIEYGTRRIRAGAMLGRAAARFRR